MVGADDPPAGSTSWRACPYEPSLARRDGRLDPAPLRHSGRHGAGHGGEIIAQRHTGRRVSRRRQS